MGTQECLNLLSQVWIGSQKAVNWSAEWRRWEVTDGMDFDFCRTCLRYWASTISPLTFTVLESSPKEMTKNVKTASMSDFWNIVMLVLTKAEEALLAFFFFSLHQSVLWFSHLHCLLPNDSDLWSRGCSGLKSMIISWVLDTFNCLMPFVLVLIVLLISFVLPTTYWISLLGNIKSSELSWTLFCGVSSVIAAVVLQCSQF